MSARVQVCAGSDALLEAAQVHVVAACAHALALRGRASLALAGGTSPRDLYARLCADPRRVDFSQVELFFGDERAVPADHADSNYAMACAAWFQPAGLSEARVHRMRGEADDLDTEAQRYEQLMRSTLGDPPAIDLMLLGMGPDGHTLSLFPGTPAARERNAFVVALHAGAPAHKRLSMTARALLAAREVLVIATGSSKAARLAEVMRGPVDTPALPIQLALRIHPRALLLCDAPAAALLHTPVAA